MKRLFAAPILLVASLAWAEGMPVSIPGPGLELAGRLYRPAGDGPFPAIVLLHGCSGMWTGPDKVNPTYEDWAVRLRDKGFVALLVDSFRPRGTQEICTQKNRAVSEADDRPSDAYAALEWLAARKDVRPDRVHVMGWSNGGSTVLHALRPGMGPPGGKAAFRSAVAFYPGCASPRLRGLHPAIPLLIQAGGADDWTPARHCEALAKSAVANGSRVEIDVYPDAHHAFDRIGGAVRTRADVRNLASPTGWGATVGPHPKARAEARERTLRFLLEDR